jgi:hypothetical protein
MSNFAFLAAEFPAVHEVVVEAERQAPFRVNGGGRVRHGFDQDRSDQDGFDLVVPRCILPPRAIPEVCS